MSAPRNGVKVYGIFGLSAATLAIMAILCLGAALAAEVLYVLKSWLGLIFHLIGFVLMLAILITVLTEISRDAWAHYGILIVPASLYLIYISSNVPIEQLKRES